MRKTFRKFLALTLCAVLILGATGLTQVNAQAQSLPNANGDSIVYGLPGQTTFVPKGYTYVYENEHGQVYTREAPCDMYISPRDLTAQEAASLALLNAEPTSAAGEVQAMDSSTSATYASAVEEILSGTSSPAEENEIPLAAMSKDTKVRVMMIFEDASVIDMDTTTVQLGQSLGQTELAALDAVKGQQITQIQAMEKRLGYNIEVCTQFGLLTNAVSATIHYGDLSSLREVAGVKQVFLMPSFSVPQISPAEVTSTSDIQPNMKYAGGIMGANAAWDLGLRGEGMSIAVIDTGLNYSNPSFTQEPEDPNAVAYTKADIADILAEKDLHAERLSSDTATDTVYYSSKIPFGFSYGDGVANYGSDDYWRGHGTHVAGILAGNLPEKEKETLQMDTLGIAPEAQLIVMNVFDQDGNCYLDYLLAALEDTILLGVDCANLSLGSSCGPAYLEGMSEVYDAARKAGINVVVAAGNDAYTGYKSQWGDGMVESSSVSTGTLGMPGTFDSVLTVASAENSFEVSVQGKNNVISWYSAKLGGRVLISFMECQNVPQGMGFKERLQGSCFPFSENFADAEGKLVFYPFSGGNADSIVKQAAQAGAAGVLLYDPAANEETDTGVNFTLTDYSIPVASTYNHYYQLLHSNRPDDGLVRVDDFWNPSGTAGQMSSFSSWGTTEALTLKPEITGIGGNVLSSYNDGFAMASGTSMASPAVAATGVLLRQYLERSSIDPAEIPHAVNCLLMSTAMPIVDEAHDTLYFVRRQGAGLANAANAIASQAYIQVDGTDKAKLELGDDPTRTGIYTMSFEVVNFSDTEKQYTLDTTVLGQVTQGGQIQNGEVTYLVYDYAKELDAKVTYSVPDGVVTVPAQSTVQVNVTLTLSQADVDYMDERFPYGAYVEGFVQLLSQDTPNLSVPFLAFYGDFAEAPVLEEGTYESILGGSRSYFTSDHFHNAIWSYRPTYDLLGTGKIISQVYLGDTRCPQYVKVPEWKLLENAAGALPFYPTQAGISPNGDGILDTFQLGLGLKRNADNVHYTVTDYETGEILWEQDTGFVPKTYYNDEAHQALYCGAIAGTGLDLDWLYPLEHHVDPYTGQESVSYDTSRCLLSENTWVRIRADVEREGGQATANDSVEFTLYIDTTPPDSQPECFKFWTETSDNQEWIDQGWMDPEDYYRMTMAYIVYQHDEYWFIDYTVDGIIGYQEDTGTWDGIVMSLAYCEEMPVKGGWSSTLVGMNLDYAGKDSRYFSLDYDYAGNVSARTILFEEHMLDYVELAADKTVIYPGETLTIHNIAENDFDAMVEWTVSDPAIAEITDYDGYHCTITGLSPGTVTVYGGFGDYMKAVDILVTDHDHEAAQAVISLIDALPAPEAVTWTDQETIGAARAAFEALTEAQQALVDNLDKLTSCEEALRASLALPFADVSEDAWYYDYILYAHHNNLMIGVDSNQFAPDNITTRAMLVTTLYRLSGAPTVFGQSTFRDVPDGRWYSDAVTWAQGIGIAQGVSETCFAPNAPLTREQAATLLYRYTALFPDAEPVQRADLSAFTDGDQVSAYAGEAMRWAVAEGFFEGYGDGTLRPTASLTRAQMAKLLTILCTKR